MPRITPSTEPPSSATRRKAALRAAAEHNYTAERVLRALEVIALCPSSAPAVAAALGVHPRTARRILQTLTKERYVERRGGRGRAAHAYQPTVRILAMAAQLAPRVPLIQNGRRAVREVEQQSELTAYLAIPCYSDVLVVACTGDRALRPWAMLPALADATGRVLLAHRGPWRESVAAADSTTVVDEDELVAIVQRGYALVCGAEGRSASLAVPVPGPPSPIAALGVRGSDPDLMARRDVLSDLLLRSAARLGAETWAADADD